jgi:hypothetical protein
VAVSLLCSIAGTSIRHEARDPLQSAWVLDVGRQTLFLALSLDQ